MGGEQMRNMDFSFNRLCGDPAARIELAARVTNVVDDELQRLNEMRARSMTVGVLADIDVDIERSQRANARMFERLAAIDTITTELIDEFDTVEAKFDENFLAMFDDFARDKERQDQQTAAALLQASIVDEALLDGIIEEDRKMFGEPQWQNGKSAEVEERPVLQLDVPRWKDSANAMIETSRTRDHNEGHIFRNGDDFTVLQPETARRFVKQAGSLTDKVRVGISDANDFLFGRADDTYFVNATNRRAVTHKALGYIERNQAAIRRHRTRLANNEEDAQ